MPLARIDLIKGKPAQYRQAVGDAVYTAMVEILKAPKDDRFQVIAEHDASNFIFDPNFFDITRSNDVIFVQLTRTFSSALLELGARTGPSETARRHW